MATVLSISPPAEKHYTRSLVASHVARNLRPYFKFTAPPVEPSNEEMDIWTRYRQDDVDDRELKALLTKVPGKPRLFELPCIRELSCFHRCACPYTSCQVLLLLHGVSHTKPLASKCNKAPTHGDLIGLEFACMQSLHGISHKRDHNIMLKLAKQR